MDVIRFQEDWATAHEQEWHKEAVMMYGEKILARLAWQPEDFEAGLVTRCVTCAGGGTPTLDAKLAAMYQQPSESHCLDCYGVGFTGGFKSGVHVTWMLAADDPDDRLKSRSGTADPDQPTAQLLWTPAFRQGDLVVRVRSFLADGTSPDVELSRNVLGPIEQMSVRTGPGPSADTAILIGQQAQLHPLPPAHSFYSVPVI